MFLAGSLQCPCVCAHIYVFMCVCVCMCLSVSKVCDIEMWLYDIQAGKNM